MSIYSGGGRGVIFLLYRTKKTTKGWVKDDRGVNVEWWEVCKELLENVKEQMNVMR